MNRCEIVIPSAYIQQCGMCFKKEWAQILMDAEVVEESKYKIKGEVVEISQGKCTVLLKCGILASISTSSVRILQ